MEKNQIIIDRELFNYINNGINHQLYTHVHGRKNSKVIKYTWLYRYGAFTWKINIFIDKIKEKYKNIKGSTDKEIIDNAQQLWINSNETNR